MNDEVLTVQGLIDALLALPLDALVFWKDHEGYTASMNRVYLDDEGDVILGNN